MLLDWARALKEAGAPARAAGAYAAAVALAPEHPKAHFKLAMVLKQLGRRERAAEHFRWAGARLLQCSGRLLPGIGTELNKRCCCDQA